jgi:hypothetical protein
MTRRKPQYRITPVEAQRRRLGALSKWIDWVNDELPVTPENFERELLIPTFHALGAESRSTDNKPITREELDGLKRRITAGFKALARG